LAKNTDSALDNIWFGTIKHQTQVYKLLNKSWQIRDMMVAIIYIWFGLVEVLNERLKSILGVGLWFRLAAAATNHNEIIK